MKTRSFFLAAIFVTASPAWGDDWYLITRANTEGNLYYTLSNCYEDSRHCLRLTCELEPTVYGVDFIHEDTPGRAGRYAFEISPGGISAELDGDGSFYGAMPFPKDDIESLFADLQNGEHAHIIEIGRLGRQKIPFDVKWMMPLLPGFQALCALPASMVPDAPIPTQADAPNPYGDTPLHEAIRQGNTAEAMAIMTTIPIDRLCAQNDLGQTPLQLAGMMGNHRIEMQLLSAGVHCR